MLTDLSVRFLYDDGNVFNAKMKLNIFIRKDWGSVSIDLYQIMGPPAVTVKK
jgi:hypothetical protein